MSVFREENTVLNVLLFELNSRLTEFRKLWDGEDVYLNRYYKGILTQAIKKLNKIQEKYKFINRPKKTKEINNVLIKALNDIDFKGEYKQFYCLMFEISILFGTLNTNKYKIKNVILRNEILEAIKIFAIFRDVWAREIDRRIEWTY